MSRMYSSFMTCRGDVPRTCGVVADCRGGKGELSRSEFSLLARAAHRPDVAAYGKIATVRDDGIAVYQADEARGVSPTFCGNATAAALRFLGCEGEAQVAVRYGTHEYEVRACISGRDVEQTWLMPEPIAEERDWRGRRVVMLDMLNPYAFVLGSLPDGIDADMARAELLGPGLSAKLAVVDGACATPTVEFHNANGRHGAAPHTGLASIALVARSLASFCALFADGHVRYRTRDGLATQELPVVSPLPDGRLALAMPNVAVDLRAYERIAAA